MIALCPPEPAWPLNSANCFGLMHQRARQLIAGISSLGSASLGLYPSDGVLTDNGASADRFMAGALNARGTAIDALRLPRRRKRRVTGKPETAPMR